MWRGWILGGARLTSLTLQNARNKATSALMAKAPGTVSRRGKRVGSSLPTSGRVAECPIGPIRDALLVHLDQALSRLGPGVLRRRPQAALAQSPKERRV